MGFTQTCFIKNNTEQLRNKLSDLGWKICLCCGFKESMWLRTLPQNSSIHGIGYYDEASSVEEELNRFLNSKEENCIDCGTNEELFLAIAALRDDSDINQWFVLDKYIGQEDLPSILEGSLCFCDKKDSKDCFPKYYEYHKATIEELINYF